MEEYLKKVIGAKLQGGIIAWKDESGKHFLIAAEEDLPGTYTYDSAKIAGRSYLGVGYTDWHLPDKGELNKLFVNQGAIGKFTSASYWSSDSFTSKLAWNQNFRTGIQLNQE